MPNPFTTAADAVRSRIEAHFDAMDDADPAKVKVGNRWGRNFRKGVKQAADAPAVDMRPLEGRGLNFSASSSSGFFQRAYELGITTDATPVDDNPDVLDAVEWELIRVAAKAALDKLGLSTVLKVEIESSRHTPDDVDRTPAARRWSGVVVLVVTLQVPRSDIIPS